jgi:hypothetical protein
MVTGLIRPTWSRAIVSMVASVRAFSTVAAVSLFWADAHQVACGVGLLVQLVVLDAFGQ